MGDFCGTLSKKSDSSKLKPTKIKSKVNLKDFSATFNDLEKIIDILFHALEDSFHIFKQLTENIATNDALIRKNSQIVGMKYHLKEK